MERVSNERSWEEFLNPEILRSRLITASLYITAFQLLKDSIVGRIQDFYMVSAEYKQIFGNNPTRYMKYQSEVLARNRSAVYASLDWLKESQAIEAKDMDVFELVKGVRNEIAHDLAQKLTKGLPSELPERFNEMVSILDKIERWWAVNVDIATDPQLQHEKIDESAIVPGRIMALRLIADIALSPEGLDTKYLSEFVRQFRSARPQ